MVIFQCYSALFCACRKLMKLGAYADRIREMERVMKEVKAEGGAAGGLQQFAQNYVIITRAA